MCVCAPRCAAARQYGNAIQTLSLCVRPLLLAGLPPPSPPAALGGAAPPPAAGGAAGMDLDPAAPPPSLAKARAAAAQAVAAAMMATTPGVDANDPPKSLAVFRFYCCVLSSVGELPVRCLGTRERRAVSV